MFSKYIRLSSVVLLLLLFSALTLVGNAKKPRDQIEFFAQADLQANLNHIAAGVPSNQDSSSISLAEVRLGIGWFPTELIKMHVDVRVQDTTVTPGYIYSDFTFSKSVPAYLRVGKYVLPSLRSYFIGAFISDSWVIDSAHLDVPAIEFGYRSEIVQVGAGIFKSSATISGDLTSNNHVNDFFGYISITPQLKAGELLFNLGFSNNVGDSPEGAAGTFTKKVSGINLEAKGLFSNFHFLVASFYRITDNDEFQNKLVVRGEVAYTIEKGMKYPLTLGAFYEYRSVPASVKTALTKANMRAGGIIGFEFADGVASKFEVWQSFSDRKETNLILQFVLGIPRHKIKMPPRK